MPRAQIAEITERLMEAPDDATRVAVVERFLVDLPDGGDHQVAHALARLDGATGDAAVAKIAREVGLSERQLERRFLTRVGVTPRRYASLRRFDRAVALAQSSATLADAALAAGYADQSHFNREFRRYAGGAPSEVLSRLL